jgi:hypothetical protein
MIKNVFLENGIDLDIYKKKSIYDGGLMNVTSLLAVNRDSMPCIINKQLIPCFMTLAHPGIDGTFPFSVKITKLG